MRTIEINALLDIVLSEFIQLYVDGHCDDFACEDYEFYDFRDEVRQYLAKRVEKYVKELKSFER